MFAYGDGAHPSAPLDRGKRRISLRHDEPRRLAAATGNDLPVGHLLGRAHHYFTRSKAARTEPCLWPPCWRPPTETSTAPRTHRGRSQQRHGLPLDSILETSPSSTLSTTPPRAGAREALSSRDPDGFYGTLSCRRPERPGGASSGSTHRACTRLVHTFNGADGGEPAAGLLLGADGNFYGTTRGGESRRGHGVPHLP